MERIFGHEEVLMILSTANLICIKRIYDVPQPSDGTRVLIDRLWPRGLPRKKAQIDEWMKDIAPSAELRQWFSHIPERYPVFSALYERELLEDPLHVELLMKLKKYQERNTLTLLYGAKNELQNHAQVLLRVLTRVCEVAPHVYEQTIQTVRSN